tara:strand:- start:429 stop:710 length:282 start_codon:yes stop_codon:yes gene_type:complete
MDKEVLYLAELHSKAPKSLTIQELETIVAWHTNAMNDICAGYLEWIWEQTKAKTDKEYQRAEVELTGLTEMWQETEPLLQKYKAVLEEKKEQK